jgi:hypothetical protein
MRLAEAAPDGWAASSDGGGTVAGHSKPKIDTCLKRYIALGTVLIDSVAKASCGDRQVDGERLADIGSLPDRIMAVT